MDTTVPQFPKGYSLLTINSDNGNLDTSLSDDQMNNYFKAINDKFQQLLDSTTKNMQTMQDALKTINDQNVQFQNNINDQIGTITYDVNANGNAITIMQKLMYQHTMDLVKVYTWKNECNPPCQTPSSTNM